MKRIFYSVVVAALGTLMFSSCSNDDVVGADKTADYQSNFEMVFGQVSPGQNFNTQKTLTIESSVTDMQGNYTLRVYDGVPSRKGSSLLGKFENLSASGTSTVQVGVSKTTKHIYCIADNGEVRQSLSAQVASKAQVTAKFDAATGAPAEAPTYSDDQLSTVTIAFEDLGSTDDFDFNDAVVKVEYATGTGKANVTLMAVGAVLPLKLYYTGGREALPLFDGQELHAAMGYDQDIMINTNRKAKGKNDGVDNVSFVTCEIDVPEDFTIGEDGAPFLLEVDGVQEQRQITASTEYGAVPQVLVTGKYYDEQTRTSYLWRWPKERVRLNLAFPTIAEWMADATNLAFLAAGVESNLYDGYDPTVVDEQPQQPTTETPEGLEAVDLGLPSGTKWANMNVGAESPEDYGGYYAWGETEEKDWYDESTYAYYQNDSWINIGADIAGTEYDVAHVKWGGDWQMPTREQQAELTDNCSYEWTNVNGVYGGKFTGPNGNSIFLPASGLRWVGDLGNAGRWGNYWSSAPSGSKYAYYLYFSSGYAGRSGNYRCFGQSVRPVITPKKEETTTPAVLEAIDLGLPSGTKWANMNVGAESPEDYGGYYAWGETEEKDWYDESTYAYYQNDSWINIGADIAGTEYDVAHVKLGGDWQMPTREQQAELTDNCSYERTFVNGVYGGKFTGPNGNSIFLPAAGSRWDGTFYGEGNYGYYWSSTQNPDYAYYAYCLDFDSGNAYWDYYRRDRGNPVRPVHRK